MFVVHFVIDSVRKLLDTLSYTYIPKFLLLSVLCTMIRFQNEFMRLDLSCT